MMTTTDRRLIVAALTLFAMVALRPASAGAQDLNNLGTTILNELNSTFLQAMAAVGIIGVSLMAMLGHLRMMTAIVICGGIVVAASATSIAGKLFGA